MILTVTLNPAVDKTCHINELMLGQVNRLQNVNSVAGGKGINVTKVLRQFDYHVIAMGFLGGFGGKMIEEKLENMGAECRFTWIEGDTRTSTNVLAENGYVTEILEPGPVISKEELQSFLTEYDSQLECAEIVVLSGSLPSGVPTDIYATLIEKAKSKKCKVFLDTSGEALKEGTKAAPYFMKPNKKELEYLVGRRLSTEEEIIKEGKLLLEMGVRKIVISMGTNGFIYMDKQGMIIQKACQVKAINTVACGDAIVASFCMSELDEYGRTESVKCAVALSAANATTGESAQIPMETYQELLRL